MTVPGYPPGDGNGLLAVAGSEEMTRKWDEIPATRRGKRDIAAGQRGAIWHGEWEPTPELVTSTSASLAVAVPADSMHISPAQALVSVDGERDWVTHRQAGSAIPNDVAAEPSTPIAGE